MCCPLLLKKQALFSHAEFTCIVFTDWLKKKLLHAFCSLSHSAHRLQAEIQPQHGFHRAIWGHLEPHRVFAPFQRCIEDQEVGCTLHLPQELSYSALAGKFNRKEERESPELRKYFHPRLPNLPSQQPISTPVSRFRFTAARCCRIHVSIWIPLPVWVGFPKTPGVYSQSLILWIVLRFKHCDHIPWVSIDLTGLSLPTWLSMKFLTKS